MDLSTLMGDMGLSFISLTPVEIQQRLWVCVGFEEKDGARGDHPHLAMIYAKRDWLREEDLYTAAAEALAGSRDVVTRIHSECILGDVFGSSMCDCGDQLRLAREEMMAHGEGLLIYLRQEGRGIGLRSKLDCLALQYGYAQGRRGMRRYSSDEANVAMGFNVDHRDYRAAAGVIKALGIGSVRLITGNPNKIQDLESEGVSVSSAVDLWTDTVSARALEEINEKISRGYIYQR